MCDKIETIYRSMVKRKKWMKFREKIRNSNNE